VANLLAVDAVMLRGEIAYREGKYDAAFPLLRRAVEMQDGLNYDEPWGKMQPIRHALGGLLVEQGHVEEAIAVFRKDLRYHPRNPFALVGLIRCLKVNGAKCCEPKSQGTVEIQKLEEQLRLQRQSKWADYEVVVACECCQHP
jgi:tetratricopeptide (TPR) repeat protein